MLCECLQQGLICFGVVGSLPSSCEVQNQLSRTSYDKYSEALLSISCDETLCLLRSEVRVLIVPFTLVCGETAEHPWAAIFKRGVLCWMLMEEKNALFRIAFVLNGLLDGHWIVQRNYAVCASDEFVSV